MVNGIHQTLKRSYRSTNNIEHFAPRDFSFAVDRLKEGRKAAPKTEAKEEPKTQKKEETAKEEKVKEEEPKTTT